MKNKKIKTKPNKQKRTYEIHGMCLLFGTIKIWHMCIVENKRIQLETLVLDEISLMKTNVGSSLSYVDTWVGYEIKNGNIHEKGA